MTTFLSAWAVVAGVSLVFAMLRALRSARTESKWHRVPGVILASFTQSAYEGYLPRVQYDYTFGGDILVGDKIRSAMTTYNWRGPSERAIERYPVGTQVTVFVNPNNPAESVLEPSDSSVSYHLGIAAGCLCIFFGAIGLLYALAR